MSSRGWKESSKYSHSEREGEGLRQTGSDCKTEFSGNTKIDILGELEKESGRKTDVDLNDDKDKQCS